MLLCHLMSYYAAATALKFFLLLACLLKLLCSHLVFQNK